MATSLTIELDLTAPTVTLGDPVRIGGVVVVPYTVDEDGVSTADVFAVSATVEPAQLVSTENYPTGGLVVVQTVAVDDVGNSRTQSSTLFIGSLATEGVGRCRISGHAVARALTAGHASTRLFTSQHTTARALTAGHVADRARLAGHAAARARNP